jgi:hypothetical protein
MAKGKYDLTGLLKEIEKTKGTTEKDDQKSVYWKPTLEKDQEKAEYLIRFLPNPDSTTGSPWIERRAHMFNFPSGKFIYEPCAKKAKKGECFICEEVTKLYAAGDPEKEVIGGKRFAKKRFFHNVLVIKDPREGGKNEGKVLIYECGDQVHNKCTAFLENSEIEASERLYFHPTLGTNFKLIIEWKKDYQNYDSSTFVRKTSAMEVGGKVLSLEEAEEFIEKSCSKLNEKILDAKVFKPYETLKSLYLNQGIADKTPAKSKDEGTEIKDPDDDVNPDFLKTAAELKAKQEKKTTEAPKPVVKVEAKKEDEDLPFDKNSDEDAELEALLKE